LFAISEGQQAEINLQFHQQTLHHVQGSVLGAKEGVNLIDIVDSVGSAAYFMGTLGGCCRFDAWLPSGDFQFKANFTGVEGQFVGSMPLHVTDTDIFGVVFSLARGPGANVPIEIGSAAPPQSAPCFGHPDPACGYWYIQSILLRPNGYAEPGPQSTQTGGIDGSGAHRVDSIILAPGSYSIAVQTAGNVYAQSITSGGDDLTRVPLVVKPNQAPGPISVVLAEGATAEGVASRDGRPLRAYIYAVPEQADGRLFQPVLSDADGKFRLYGLAPASYLFFATDVELFWDIRNPAALLSWQQFGRYVTLHTGTNSQIALQVVSRTDNLSFEW